MDSRPRQSVLVIGASGIVGKSAIQEFIDAGWETHGISRRYPEVLAVRHDAKFQHHKLDLFDVEACKRELLKFSFVTHILYAALIEQEGDLMDSWQSAQNCQDNQTMMENCMSVLLKECKNLEHVQWLQGTKAYGVHYRGILVPARERDPRDPLNTPNWYWTQEDWMMEQLKGTNIRWTIHRPCCIWGDALGKPMCPTKCLPLYAIIRKYRGEPLEYPIVDSTAYCCHVDGDMLGRLFIWAATSPNAHGESFNSDNGDVWEFRALWRSLSAYYGMPVADKDTHFTLDGYFKQKEIEQTWEEIVNRFGLRKYTLEQMIGQSAQTTDIQMNNCPDDKKLGGGRPWIESRVKLTQAGFTECVDTEDMAFKFFKRMEGDKLLPSRQMLEQSA
ncbi:hypothetical protein GE09DRAFT_1158762 [Coniochaeta sp. 2T2.1]|nr:hypothetical protein GE09DRAFT_1158762 [Coniochaeta sp. 2T2.1]